MRGRKIENTQLTEVELKSSTDSVWNNKKLQ